MLYLDPNSILLLLLEFNFEVFTINFPLFISMVSRFFTLGANCIRASFQLRHEASDHFTKNMKLAWIKKLQFDLIYQSLDYNLQRLHSGPTELISTSMYNAWN